MYERARYRPGFPFLLGRAFIEAAANHAGHEPADEFPFLLGRAFIEASVYLLFCLSVWRISLPSRKGFH